MITEARQLFRPEAVAYHERGEGPGSLVRHSGWLRFGFAMLLAAVAVGVFLLVEVRVAPSVTGAAQVDRDSGRLTVTIPGGPKGLRPGLAIVVATTSGPQRGQVASVATEPSSVGLSVSSGETSLVRVRLDRAVPPAMVVPGPAVVALPAERLAVVLVPALGGLLG
jgi:hypothetical protein